LWIKCPFSFLTNNVIIIAISLLNLVFINTNSNNYIVIEWLSYDGCPKEIHSCSPSLSLPLSLSSFSNTYICKNIFRFIINAKEKPQKWKTWSAYICIDSKENKQNPQNYILRINSLSGCTLWHYL
jgi:hypothetical protein